MTSEELINELKKNDEDDISAVDLACYERLRRVAKDFGKEGEIADQLLVIVKRLLDM